MPQPKLDPAVAKEAYDAWVAAGYNVTEAAKVLGLSRSTVNSRLDQAKLMARKGEFGTDPVVPGFEISKIKTVERDGKITQRSITQSPSNEGDALVIPSTHGLGKITAAIEPDGRISKLWGRYHPGVIDYDAFAEKLEAKYAAIEFNIPEIPAPSVSIEEHLNFFGLGDLHYGLRISGREVGGEDWNIAKADRVYRQAFSNLAAIATPAKKCVLMIGGDVTHQNDGTNRTPKSNHVLDVDGTYTDAVEAAQEFILDATMMAAQVHEEVEVAFIHGNHDQESIVAVASFIRGAFRGHDRISVTPPRKRVWVKRHGLTMIASVHGDTMKPELLPGFMSAEHAEMWGETKFRYGHTFHVHHKTKTIDEMNGVCLVTHQCPAPRDSWHYYMAFLSGRSFEFSTYHTTKGYRGSLMEQVLPQYTTERGSQA